MKFILLIVAAAVTGYSLMLPSTAAEVQPFDVSRLIDERLQVQKADPTHNADDATFLRRASLDLIGRIPTISEVYQYVDENSDSKHDYTIERMLNSGAFYRTQATLWRRAWVPQADTPEYAAVANEFEAWIAQELQRRTPYDQLVRKVVMWNPNQVASSELSPRGFYEANDAQPENLAASSTRAFLGINLDCAQCHNHPFARWTREQFWQTAAFFADFSIVDSDSKLPLLTIPDTELKCQPALLSEAGDVALPANATSAGLKQTLVDWMSAEKERYLARNAVNRIWAHFFGQAIVEPMDDLSADAAQSGPRAELLDELSQRFIDSHYDITMIIKAIVQSDAYRQASATSNAEQQEASNSAPVQTALVRAMTGEQLYDSLRTAAGLPAETSAQRGDNDRDTFTARFHIERSHDAQRSISQALTMMNGRQVNELCTAFGNRMLASIVASPFMSADQQIDTVFVAVLGRHVTADESKVVKQHFDSQPTRSIDNKLSQLFWALINSPEFNTNH